MREENRSVVNVRLTPTEGKIDFFITPPWATRALYEILESRWGSLKPLSAWDPCAGAGHMWLPLKEAFGIVYTSDKHPELSPDRKVEQLDFLTESGKLTADWIIANPPFKHAEAFAGRALSSARVGAAMLVRTSFLEGVGRHNHLFSRWPPMLVAQFAERVPMVQGRIDQNATTMTSYCWIIWARDHMIHRRTTELVWIPPCRKRLERDGDYTDLTVPDLEFQNEVEKLT
jgi:hypothetical protein